MLEFTTTEAAAELEGNRFLVYSPAGHGKTMLCATMPCPLILASDKGLRALKMSNQMRIFGSAEDWPTIPVNNVKDANDALDFIENETEKMAAIESICFDGLSELAEGHLEDCEKLTLTKAGASDMLRAYGLMGREICALIRRFRNLPPRFHVYMTAKMDRNDDSGIMCAGPMMPGKMVAANLSYFFTQVMYLGIETPEKGGFRYLLTKPNFQFYAKDRDSLLDEIEEPHLGKIITKLKNR